MLPSNLQGFPVVKKASFRPLRWQAGSGYLPHLRTEPKFTLVSHPSTSLRCFLWTYCVQRSVSNDPMCSQGQWTLLSGCVLVDLSPNMPGLQREVSMLSPGSVPPPHPRPQMSLHTKWW